MHSASQSTTTPELRSVAIALGSNVGDRRYWLLRAIADVRRYVNLVRVSEIFETAPVGAPSGSGDFLNQVIVGFTKLSADDLVQSVLESERNLGRRRGVRNAPRNIDIDVILVSGCVVRRHGVVIPHPRYREREFVLAPLRQLRMPWVDPTTGRSLERLFAAAT